MNSIDEPFADSSAFNFYLLSKFTRKHVKVALSGDGADELFKGYNKHRALELVKSSFFKIGIQSASAIAGNLKGSRDGKLNNKLRQLKKLNQLAKLSDIEKQIFLATISEENYCNEIILKKNNSKYFDSLFSLNFAFQNFYIDDAFDLQTVLPDEMLVKADRFSMRHGIEIRNPFLDYRVVEFALNLNSEKIISRNAQKIILRNEFKNLLPEIIFTRSKKGFELPIQKWLKGNLNERLDKIWLNKNKLQNENIYNVETIENLKHDLRSSQSGDTAAKIWALIVFEIWYENFKPYILKS